MKNCAVYIIPDSTFNSEVRTELENTLSPTDIEYLRITNYANLVENVVKKIKEIDVYAVFDESEGEKISGFIPRDEIKKIIIQDFDIKKIILELTGSHFTIYKNNILIKPDLINLRPTDLERHINILSVDDRAISITKSLSDEILLFGFNHYSERLIKYYIDSENRLDKFLSYNKNCNYYISVMSNALTAKTIKEFKNLYNELSQKSSWEYCSQEMHERYTHLFIEYKELLK